MARNVVRVPQVMQMEALECGAACLDMILAYYGRWVPLEVLRCDCGVSRDGSKAVSILRAARSYGLKAKGMSFSTRALREKGTFPCILFWNFNHFVVLRGFRGKYAYINDPARGQVRVKIEDFDKSFTGVVLVFEKGEDFQPGGERTDHVKVVRRYLKGLGPAMAFVMLTVAITSLLTILNTSLSRVFLDRILDGGASQWLLLLVGVMLLSTTLSMIVGFIRDFYLVRIQGKIAVVASSRFMRHLLHLPVVFYEQRMVGDLQQRQAANETIVFTLVGQLGPVLINIVMLVLYLAIMLDYSVLLTVVGIVSVIINAVTAHFISRQRVNISRSMVTDAGKLYATSVYGIDMIETIKAAGAEVGYFQRWAGFQANYCDGSMRMASVNSYLGSIPELVDSLGNLTVLILGIWFILNQEFTPGSLLAFQGFLGSFMSPVKQLITLGQSVQETQTQIERVEDVMRYECDTPEDFEGEDGATTLFGREKLRGEIDLENVSFGYSPLEDPLIENFNLHLESGQWVALVGSSGSGKSTLGRLVSGLYSPWSGEVRFDGTPISDVPLAVLRASLAVVDQEIVTFDDTVSENVKLWDRTIEDYEVVMACRDSGIHRAILEREGGYSSRILPGGRNFSGGELQRIEIARVLAQDPTIVILDEATSALDARCEADVIKRIRDRGITCIVVAHRLSTIRDCDEIIVLDNGKVVERGSHSELMGLDGAYAKLVRDA